MASTASPSLQLEIPGDGDYRGVWAELMQRILTQIDKSIAGVTNISTTGGTTTLNDDEYVDNQSRQAQLVVGGTLSSNATIVVPARRKTYIIRNDTAGAFTVSFKTASGSPILGPASGSVGQIRVYNDGSIDRVGPYVNRATGAITSQAYALDADLSAEVARASGVEATLSKTDGSRAFTNPVSGVTPTSSAHLATKAYVDSLSGINDNVYVTGGTSTAYTVSTGLSLSLADGLSLNVRLHATNGASPTFKVDSATAKPLRGFTGKSLPAGVGILGSVYRVVYVSATDEWFLAGFFDNPYQIPIGGFLPFCSTSVPNSNFVLPFGQAISRTTYATLFALVGTAFGAGDGSSTFNVPDLRGRSVFGLDNMGGTAANRITNAGSGIVGTTIGAFGGGQNVSLLRDHLPSLVLGFSGDAVDSHRHALAANIDRSNQSDNLTANNQIVKDNDNGGGGSYRLSRGGTSTEATIGRTGPAGGFTPSGTIENLNGDAQVALNKMPPAIMLPMLLRVI